MACPLGLNALRLGDHASLVVSPSAPATPPDRGIADFIRMGAEAGQFVLILLGEVTRDRVTAAAAHGFGAALRDWEASGRVELMGSAQALRETGGFDPTQTRSWLRDRVLAALGDGHRAARIFSQPGPGERGSIGTALECERLVDTLFGELPLILVCQYTEGSMGARELHLMGHAHRVHALLPRLHGEDLDSRDGEDARHWYGVYRQLAALLDNGDDIPETLAQALLDHRSFWGHRYAETRPH